MSIKLDKKQLAETTNMMKNKKSSQLKKLICGL